MTLPFSDELISAYLDGELTAEEQQYVEEQLRENADLRRTYDELRRCVRRCRRCPSRHHLRIWRSVCCVRRSGGCWWRHRQPARQTLPT